MAKYIEKAEQSEFDCIPLRGTVVFPQIPISFELDDKARIEVCENASKTGTALFFCLLPEGKEEVESVSDLSPVGCIGRIKQLIKLPDGSAHLLVNGIARGRVLSVAGNAKDGFRVSVMCKRLLVEGGGARTEALVRDTLAALDRFVQYLPNPSKDLVKTIRAISTPGLLSDYIASHILVRPADQQAVLEEFNPYKRLELVDLLLESEAEILATEQQIHKKVKQQIDRNQREYYLREQMKVIAAELSHGGMSGEDGSSWDEEYDEEAAEQDDLREYGEKIAAIAGDAFEEVRQKLQKELKRLSRMPFGSAENSVLRNYLDTALDYPFGKTTRDRVDTAAARRILDRDHDGLEKVKERILEYLAVKQKSPQLPGQILCLVGPPGVGKSSIAASIAKAMNRKFVRVSLGGIRDEADIRGHRKTYVGSMPGRIVAAISQCGVSNPLILLDELDKLTRDAHGDPASALLEVLDPEQNRTFRDHFMEIPIDLSGCIFLATANTLETVPTPLLDRIEVIELSSYSRTEKLAIAKHHLIPKQLARHGLTRRQLSVTDGAVYEIIDHYTRESGVRTLERQLAALMRKAAKRSLEDESAARQRVSEKNIADYLGKRKVLPDSVSECDEVGEVNGLAWTESGGDMLKIEVLSVPGTGKLELTGSLGDVMKESAKAALTFVRSRAGALGISPDFPAKRDIHIHVPEGAVPKDGPSAGVTIITALASELSGRAVRRDLAMTGEITLRGRVLPIGGLREKTMAACRAGVHTVLFPDKNLPDLEELDPAVRDALELIPVSTADEVLSLALLPPEVAVSGDDCPPLFIPQTTTTTATEPRGAYLSTPRTV